MVIYRFLLCIFTEDS